MLHFWKKLTLSCRSILKIIILLRRLLIFVFISTALLILYSHRNGHLSAILPPKITEQSTFVYSAFILPSNELRIITTRSCRNKNLIIATVRLLNHTEVELKLSARSISYCEGKEPCYFQGLLLSTILPAEYDPEEKIELRIANETRSVSISPIISKSLPAERSHIMVSCIQPMFLFVDWITLVQHIETYQQIGVTKFFIYVQSVSQEVQLILKMYEEAGVVELLPWSLFDYDERRDVLNVNNFVYRADMVTAVNDCLLRVRPLSRFALFTDVDEIISSLSPNISLIDLVEREFSSSDGKASSVGSLMFRSATVRVPPIADEERFDASSVPFDHLRLIKHEGIIWKPGSMSKVLLRTDAVRIMHVHGVRKFESGQNWTNKVINETDGLVFHFRRPFSTSYPKTKEPTIQKGLEIYASKAQERWRRRIAEKYSDGGLKLPYYAQSVLQRVNDCVQKDLYPRMDKFCMAPPVYCLKVAISPFTNQSLTFEYAEENWLVF